MAKGFWRNVRSGKRKAAIMDLSSIMRKEVERTMRTEVAPALLKTHEDVVSDWKHRPEFRQRVSLTAKRLAVFIFPAGEHKDIWIYVDQGTKPHVIVPKNARMLRFRTGYKAKTAPGAGIRGGGGGATGPVVWAKKVNHPGSKARKFSEQIAKDIQPEAARDIENAFRRGARRTYE